MTNNTVNKPLIVQSDYSILAEVDNPLYHDARNQLLKFAELVKSPEHIHTYRITPLSLWNASALGISAEEIKQTLITFSKYQVPVNILSEIDNITARYGKIVLYQSNQNNFLSMKILDSFISKQIISNHKIANLLKPTNEKQIFLLEDKYRGTIKQLLIKLGYPVVDLVGYVEGDYCSIRLREETVAKKKFIIRNYQAEAAEMFYQGGTTKGGNGVIVLPCGAGKTIVALIVMSKLQCHTLIIVTSVAAVHQWIREICDKTYLTADMVGEYTGDNKQIRPITIATYHILTHRKKKEQEFVHFDLFNSHNWGLIIYDEVHLLPAQLFRITAELQSRRRLGMTATLIREDGNEDMVFSLIGPKRYDAAWKELETQGWIAEAVCNEIRVPAEYSYRLYYASATLRKKFKIASCNPLKLSVIKDLLQKHFGEPTLIIGQYLDQLKKISDTLKIPLITGQTPNSYREELYQKLQSGEITVLIVSKVANFSIDLPAAKVLIQVSGMYGSRQEEAQRLGRILRPKTDSQIAHFYTLVTKDTIEQSFVNHRQLFLTEQGYRYEIEEYTLEEINEINEETTND